MRTRAERRKNNLKKFKRRMDLSKAIRYYVGDDLEGWLKRKSDVPHSINSDWWNGYETKSIKHKQQRLKDKAELKKDIKNEFQ